MREPAHLPLFDWAQANGDRGERSPGLSRSVVLIAAAVSIGAIATLLLPPRPAVVWNASASAPLGLYRISAMATPAVGDMVIARLPRHASVLAARRGYLPQRVPALKRIAAASGDTVCAIGPVLSINGVQVAQRLRRDAAGRRLPWWEGCTTLSRREVLLLMEGSTGSFDGRYFGPSSIDDILGGAHHLCAV